MTKILITLWVIIISGAIFIFSNLSNTEASPSPEPPTEELHEDLNTAPLNEKESQNYRILLARGDKHFASEEYNLAVHFYKKAKALNNTNTRLKIKLANTYLITNQAQKAKDTFEEAAQIAPNSEEIKLGLVQSMLNLRLIEEAKELLFTLDQENYQVQYYKGIILILAKEFEAAKITFQTIIDSEESPEDTEENSANEASSELITQSKIFTKAFEDFSYFREGETIHLQTLLAKALIDNKQYEAAIPLLFDVINTKLNYRDAWTALGYSYLQTGKINDAIDSLAQALILDDQDSQTLFFAGLAEKEAGNTEKAIFYLEKAEKHSYPDLTDLHTRLANTYFEAENYPRASDYYERAINSNPQSINTIIRAIWINIEKLNNPEKALDLANIALKNYPDLGESYNLMGWTLTANGDYKLAETYLEKALEENPDFDAAYLNLGWLYHKVGNPKAAEEYYKKAMEFGHGTDIAKTAENRINQLNEAEK